MTSIGDGIFRGSSSCEQAGLDSKASDGSLEETRFFADKMIENNVVVDTDSGGG